MCVRLPQAGVAGARCIDWLLEAVRLYAGLIGPVEHANMALNVRDRLPEATFLEYSGGEPRAVSSAEVFAGRVAVFGMPGAYTRTCDGAHMPSVVRTAEALRDEGVDRIVVIAVNDPFVMAAWGASSGATAAGVRMLGDAAGTFTKAIGMDFDAPPAGYYGRSRRYGALVEDGVVVALGIEESRTECSMSGGEALLDAVRANKGKVA
jgi:glutaredoxin/glutathione-dependent peroxiredoxin